MLERQGSPLYKTFAAKRDAQCYNRRRLCYAVIAGFVSLLVVCLIYALLPCSSTTTSPVSNSTTPSPASNSTLMDRSRDFAINITGG